MANFSECGKGQCILIAIIIGAACWIAWGAIYLSDSAGSHGDAVWWIWWILALIGDACFVTAFGLYFTESMCGDPWEMIESTLLFIGSFLFLVGHIIAMVSDDGSGADAYWQLCLAGAACWTAGFGIGFIAHMVEGSFCDPWQETVGIILFFIGAILFLVSFVLWHTGDSHDGKTDVGLWVGGCVCFIIAALFQLFS